MPLSLPFLQKENRVVRRSQEKKWSLLDAVVKLKIFVLAAIGIVPQDVMASEGATAHSPKMFALQTGGEIERERRCSDSFLATSRRAK